MYVGSPGAVGLAEGDQATTGGASQRGSTPLGGRALRSLLATQGPPLFMPPV